MNIEKTSSFFFSLVILLIFAFTTVFLGDIDLYDTLSREDHLAENLSALFLFLTGLCFFSSFLSTRRNKAKQSVWLSIALLFVSIVFCFAAGEEISWGQRIFNLETPEYLLSINDQNELNVHNIDKKFFDRMLDWVTIIFVISASILLIRNKKALFGIQYPDIFILCAFAITPFYRQKFGLNFYHLMYLPLFGLLMYAFINKVKQFYFPIITTLVVSVIIPLVHTHFYHLFPTHNNSANEYRELLFCLCCAAYACLILVGFKHQNKRV